jgi:hypothetical protein
MLLNALGALCTPHPTWSRGRGVEKWRYNMRTSASTTSASTANRKYCQTSNAAIVAAFLLHPKLDFKKR